MNKYEKISFKGADMKRAKSQIVKVISEDDLFLRCYFVNREGERYEDYYQKDGTLVEREHLIDKGAISERVSMKWDLHYGELTAETD